MIFKCEEFSQTCVTCDGKGRIYSNSDGLIIVKECPDCNGTGEVLTEEGEAIFNLLLLKTTK